MPGGFPQESGMVTRTHIGALLAERGRASTPMEAVREYMVPGGIGYVPKARFSPEECAKLIRKAGGAVIIAHINQIAKDPSKALSTARELLVENIATVWKPFTANTTISGEKKPGGWQKKQALFLPEGAIFTVNSNRAISGKRIRGPFCAPNLCGFHRTFCEGKKKLNTSDCH